MAIINGNGLASALAVTGGAGVVNGGSGNGRGEGRVRGGRLDRHPREQGGPEWHRQDRRSGPRLRPAGQRAQAAGFLAVCGNDRHVVFRDAVGECARVVPENFHHRDIGVTGCIRRTDGPPRATPPPARS